MQQIEKRSFPHLDIANKRRCDCRLDLWKHELVLPKDAHQLMHMLSKRAEVNAPTEGCVLKSLTYVQ